MEQQVAWPRHVLEVDQKVRPYQRGPMQISECKSLIGRTINGAKTLVNKRKVLPPILEQRKTIHSLILNDNIAIIMKNYFSIFKK